MPDNTTAIGRSDKEVIDVFYYAGNRIMPILGDCRTARISEGNMGHSAWEINRILGSLTIKRAVNMLLLLLSFQLSRLLRKPLHMGMPAGLSFEPTTACNLRCPQCPSGLRSFSRPTGMLQPDTFERTIDELACKLIYLTLYFQGEPYLNRSFFDMVQTARNRGLFTCTSTNAHFLDDNNARKTVECGLDRLIISLDGITEESYKKYRIGGSLALVLEGARNVMRWKRRLGRRNPEVYFQFLVFRWNEHEIPEVRRLAASMGIRTLIKTAQVYDYSTDEVYIPKNPAYARYRMNPEGNYEPAGRIEDRCWRMWHAPVVTWDGQVLPCCFDKDAAHALGSLSDASFGKIWKGPEYKKFRKQLMRARKEIEICRNCSEGNPVWL